MMLKNPNFDAIFRIISMRNNLPFYRAKNRSMQLSNAVKFALDKAVFAQELALGEFGIIGTPKFCCFL
ncbi:hypothetical protein TSUD_208450 [Trifolium subterraneum]|uniref:Uncharacterized protein n=1 Tax=Trifolium subterraneum TaxID=3900 RepID=A0A2Z6N1M4_TRISU|nr:hypothetical protein TSUD_208450 [Trifolium subterraneum]